jgi:hypothetical protein
MENFFAGISPYAFCVFEPKITDDLLIDDTTEENIYEEITENFGETTRLAVEEPIYDTIS